MPESRFEWHERIKAVEREHGCLRIAVDRLSSATRHDPTELGDHVTPRDLLAADENLSGTYLIRMFAEFETALRSYWAFVRPRARPSTEVLLNAVGARRRIPQDLIDDAHSVRNYRNRLVHARTAPASVVAINEARSFLAKYLARLPEEWGN